ncbi:AraC family transcriptional regulator [Paenibacillaceae bacterium]|nr:AraC family transcriptional regulator [Paenibacillaceae bacterium]
MILSLVIRPRSRERSYEQQISGHLSFRRSTGSARRWDAPPYITLAHLFNAPQIWGIQPRTLKQYQFQYVVEGAAAYTIEGQEYITKRGDLIYHAPDEIHEVYTLPGEPYVCISILFHFGQDDFPVQELLGPHHFLGRFINHAVDRKLSQLAAYYHQPGPTYALYCKGLLLQLFHDIASWRAEPGQAAGNEEKIRARIVLLKNYIADHYAEDVRHRDLERISGLSRNYLIIKFKQAYGMTPTQYLCAVRVQRAKELAVHSNLTIGEIALQVGYADVHTFGRMFKSKTGMSLSRFCASIVTR